MESIAGSRETTMMAEASGKVVVEANVNTGRMCGAIKGTRTEPWGHHDLRVHKATLKGDEKELARKTEGKPGESEVTEPKEEKV